MARKRKGACRSENGCLIHKKEAVICTSLVVFTGNQGRFYHWIYCVVKVYGGLTYVCIAEDGLCSLASDYMLYYVVLTRQRTSRTLD